MAKELIPVPSTLSGIRPKEDGRLLAKVNVLREIQSAGGEELRRSWTLMPSPCGDASRSVLDRAYKSLPPDGDLTPCGAQVGGMLREESCDPLCFDKLNTAPDLPPKWGKGNVAYE